MGEIHENAENDYMLGMKYAALADKYGVSINTIKSWKQRYGWSREGKKKCAHKKNRKVCTQKETPITEEEIQMDRDSGLSVQEELFCRFYNKSYNATQSYLRVYQCSYQAAAVSAHRMLKKPKILEFLKILDEEKKERLLPKVSDVAELQARIAFADLSGVISIDTEKGIVEIENPDLIDWQTVAEVKNTKYGISIKLKDSQKAIDWLKEYHAQARGEEEEEKRGIVILPDISEVMENECVVDTTAQTETVHGETGV